MKQQSFTSEIEQSLLYDPLTEEESIGCESEMPRRMMQDDWMTDETEPPVEPATREEAIYFLTTYFRNRQSHCGGPIPTAELVTGRHIDMVLRLELSDCIDLFHECLESIYFGLSGEHRQALFDLRKKLKRSKIDWDQFEHDDTKTSDEVLDKDERKLYKLLWDKLKVRHIELLKQLQKQAYDLAIPRHHSGGLLLVWLHLCMGFDI